MTCWMKARDAKPIERCYHSRGARRHPPSDTHRGAHESWFECAPKGSTCMSHTSKETEKRKWRRRQRKTCHPEGSDRGDFHFLLVLTGDSMRFAYLSDRNK